MFRPLSIFNRNRNAPSLRGAEAGDPFFQLHREMNRLFDDFFTDFASPSLMTGAASGVGAGGARGIHMDVHETKDAFELEAELPGVSEDDIHVELNENLLTIRGEKTVEEKGEDDAVRRRSYSSFQRSLSLPFDVDPNRIDATFKNGVLKLTLPKPAELETSARKIAVKRG